MVVVAKRRAGGRRSGLKTAGLRLLLGLRGRHRSSGAALFTPDMLPGLLYWYDGSDASTLTPGTGSGVAQINDKSGNARHLVQVTPANQPTTGGVAPYVSPNGKTGLTFLAGNQHVLTNAATTLASSDVTSFFAGMMRSTGASGARFVSWAQAASADNNSTGIMPHIRSGTTSSIGIIASVAALSTAVYDQWFVHSSMRLAAEFRSSIDGGADTVLASGVTAMSGVYTRLAIGCGWGPAALAASYVTGVVGENFAYNRQLNATEYAMCQGYLAWRWGTQALLPVGHPWALRAPPALGPFVPTQLSGLIYWYDFSDVAAMTLVGSKISQINDKSISAVPLLQNTDANRPVVGGGIAPPSGLGYASFVGATPTHLITGAANIAVSDVTSFMSGYLRSTAPSGARGLTWSRAGIQDSTAGGTMLHFRNGTGQIIGISGTSGTATNPIVYDQWFVNATTRLAAEVRSALNGGADTIVTASVSAPLGPITRLCIGTGLASASFNPSGGWEGGIGEIFGYNRLLSALEKQYGEGYLAWRIGNQASLPAGHAFQFRQPYAIAVAATPAPVNSVAPAVTPTTGLNLGVLLTSTSGTWSGSPTFGYQWQRGGSNIAGATAATYTLAAADDGATITCRVTASNAGGPATADSNAVGPAATTVPANTLAPAITPTTPVYVGVVLTTTNGTWIGNPSPTFAYQWKRGATNIGTNAATYTLVAGDVGSNITCVVTATNINSAGVTATSNAVGPITALLGTPTTPVARVANNVTTLTSTAFNPPANGLLLIGSSARLGATLAPLTLSNNSSLAPSLISDVSQDTGSGNRARQRVWGLLTGSSPPTGVTFSTTNGAQCRQSLYFVFIPNATMIPVATDVAGAPDGGGDPVVILDHTPNAASTIISMFGGATAADTPLTPLSGFTELEDLWEAQGQMQIHTSYDIGNGAARVDWVTACIATCASLIEVRQP